MKDVQYENGYTKIANELLEVVMKQKLNGTQFKIIMAVWRYTYGFSRKEHEMSLGFISKATGVHKQTVKTELEKLIENKIIKVTSESTYTKSRKLAFNKHYDEWNNLQSVNAHTVSEYTDSTVSEMTDSTVSESTYQERNIKENIKENTSRSKLKFETNHMKLAELLFRLIKENNPKAKNPNFKQWADDFRKVMDIDKREGKEVQDIILWSQQDSFWHKNILSPDKLRKQYDRLYLEMNSKKPKQQEPTGRYIPDFDEIDLTAGED